MKNFFEPEDFGGDFGNHYTSRLDAIGAAQVANEKLNKLIESWPAVYSWQGFKNDDGSGIRPIKDEWTTMTGVPNTTHKARLAFIEEIKAEPCKHEPSWHGLKTDLVVDRFDNTFASVGTTCSKCGVKLLATWKESK